MSQIVDRFNGNRHQDCGSLRGKPLGFESCFTAFLVLFLGTSLSVSAFILELGAGLPRMLRRDKDSEEQVAVTEPEDLAKEVERLKKVIGEKDELIYKLEKEKEWRAPSKSVFGFG